MRALEINQCYGMWTKSKGFEDFCKPQAATQAESSSLNSIFQLQSQVIHNKFIFRASI